MQKRFMVKLSAQIRTVFEGVDEHQVRERVAEFVLRNPRRWAMSIPGETYPVEVYLDLQVDNEMPSLEFEDQWEPGEAGYEETGPDRFLNEGEESIVHVRPVRLPSPEDRERALREEIASLIGEGEEIERRGELYDYRTEVENGQWGIRVLSKEGEPISFYPRNAIERFRKLAREG